MCKLRIHSIYQLSLLCFIMLIGASLYYLNSLYPISRDDFIYAFHPLFLGDRIQTTGDIISSVQHYYMNWFGRIIPTILTEFFVIQGKDVFNVCNIIVYLAFTACLAGLVRPFLLSRWVIISALFWIAIPLPEDTIFWMCGSCFYLWMYFLASLFLFTLSSKHTVLRTCALPLAAITGIGHESVSFGLVTFLLIYSFLDKKQHKGKLYYGAILILILSTSVCVLAPGNSAHASSTTLHAGNPFVGHLLTALRGMAGVVYHIIIDGDIERLWALVIFFVGGVANLYYRYKTGAYKKTALSFLCASVICLIFPIVVNSASPRALSVSSFYTFLSLLALTTKFQTARKLTYFVPVAILVYTATYLIWAYPRFAVFNESITYVREQAKAGNTIIVLPAERITPNRYAYRSGDPSIYSKRDCISKYYHCKPYVVIKDDTVSSVLRDVDLKSLNEELPYTVIQNLIIIKRAKEIESISVLCDSPDDSYIIKVLSAYLPKVTRINYFPIGFVDDGHYYAFIDGNLKNIQVTISYGLQKEEEIIHINSSL